MSLSLIEWEAEAERLGGRFWQPAGPGRRIARAYFGGTTYVEVDLFQQSDEINELTPPRISFPRNAVITEETRIAANALARWRPDKTNADPPSEAKQRIAPDTFPKGKAWLGWLWILLIIAILATIGYSVANAGEPPAIPDVYAVKSPEPDRRGTAAEPLVIGKMPEDAAHAANERDLTNATKILALFTFALWIANVWLIIETKRASSVQAKATRDAIGEAKRSADAMRDVATATKENAALMSGMLSKQMRAYIQVNIGKSTAQREEGIVFGSWPEIVNVGLTPAKRVSYRIMADILDPRFGSEFVYPEPERVFTNDATLNPRQSFTIMVAVKDRFDAADVETISKGQAKRLFVWGVVTYEDVFGDHRETRFSHNFVFFDQPDPETGKIEHKVNSFYSAGHNDAT